MSAHNARSVVQAWRNGPSSQHWDAPALSATPSLVNRAAAEAFAAVKSTADHQADVLRRGGFKPGHPTIVELRGIASDAARRSQGLYEWANELAEAEKEADDE